MTTAIAVTDEMVEIALRKWFNDEVSWDRGMAPWMAEQFRSEMRSTISAALTPHGEDAAATHAPQHQPIGFMDVDGLRTLVGEVRARPAASPSPQDHVPVLYVSEQQLEQCIGTYLPTRKEAEGNFQLALYRHPSPQTREER